MGQSRDSPEAREGPFSPFSRRTNSATDVMPVAGGFSSRRLPLSRCEQSPIALRKNVSLGTDPGWLSVSGSRRPFSHSSELMRPLTSQHQLLSAQAVPFEKPLQSSQMSVCYKALTSNNLRRTTRESDSAKVTVMRKAPLTGVLTVLTIVLNIRRLTAV